MATLTVTLTDPESVATALRALTALMPDAVSYSGDTISDVKIAQPENDGTQLAAYEQAAGRMKRADTTSDTPAEPTEHTNDEPNPQTPDIHGLVWNEEIHSSPPRHNADGSWRARKGRKAEYDAAVEAARAAPVSEQTDAPVEPEPQPTGPAMPAAPAPTTPEPPVDYEQMARRFMSMMESGAISDFNAVYQALDIDYNELETNQTMIAALWNYMDALDNGEAHDGAVRHAMGAA